MGEASASLRGRMRRSLTTITSRAFASLEESDWFIFSLPFATTKIIKTVSMPSIQFVICENTTGKEVFGQAL